MAATVEKLSEISPLNEDLDEKKNTVTSRLQKRDEERISELQKKKEIKESTEAKNENADFFWENFNAAKSEVESSLVNGDSLEKSSLSDHFDSIAISIQKLQKFLSDSTFFLTSFEVQKSQELINKLQAQSTEKREELMPKKKFAFKSKKKVETQPKLITERKDEKREIKVNITDCSLVDLKNEKLEKSGNEINRKDVALARLEGCEVKLKGAPGTVHMDNLQNCKIFCGPVSGSIFIDGCKNCTFVVACQQLRIHTTVETQFYIHVTSKAIIEDCNTVQFAPYNWVYDEMHEHYQLSGLDKTINNWQDVDDFNWLACDKKSPNWEILSVEKRATSWD